MSGTGTEDVAFMQVEGSFDLITNSPSTIAIVAADAFAYMDMELAHTKNREHIDEHCGSASHQGSVDTNEKGTGSISAKLRLTTNGSSTPIPVLEDLFQIATIGTPTESAGISMTYNLDTAAAKSGVLLRHNKRGGNRTELISGMIVTQLEIEQAGENAPPTVTAAIEFASYSYLVGSPEVGARLTGESDVTVSAGFRDQLDPVGMCLAFGSENRGGSGYVCTSYSKTTGVLVFTPVLVGDVSASDVVSAVVPTETIAGAVAKGSPSGCSVGGQSLDFISWKATLDTGITFMELESSSAKPTGAEFGAKRLLSGDMSFYLKDGAGSLGVVRKTMLAWRNTTQALILRAGANTSGERFTVNAPAALLKTFSMPGPMHEHLQHTVEWEAQQSATADDEGTYVSD